MVEPEDLVRLVDAGSPQLGCPPVAIDFPITGRGRLTEDRVELAQQLVSLSQIIIMPPFWPATMPSS
jgi:hypothetical protein